MLMVVFIGITVDVSLIYMQVQTRKYFEQLHKSSIGNIGVVELERLEMWHLVECR